MTWEKSVYSSNVNTVGYDVESKELFISWSKGKRSVYTGVPEELALQLTTTNSVGTMLNQEIKPYYGHRYG